MKSDRVHVAEAALVLAAVIGACCWLIGFSLPAIFGASFLVTGAAVVAVLLPGEAN